jgi:hypothetical protein
MKMSDALRPTGPMKLAIIGPSFFGYLERACGIFSARGISAGFFDDRPRNSVTTKTWLRFAPSSLKAASTAAHCRKTADHILAGGFTHVLLVSPEIFSAQETARLKAAGLVLCRYGWDSVANKPHMKTLDPLMDRIASFDPVDCARYGYAYIPLYSDIRATPQGARNTALMYCATLHSRRPHLVLEMMRRCQAGNLSARFMLFYHARWLWLLRYGWNPSLWPLIPLISTKPFSRDAIAQAMEDSRIVLDIHHHGQDGLTMRFFETLAGGAIVLTTNAKGLVGLPDTLSSRVVTFEPDTVAEGLRLAYERVVFPLSAQDLYFLSVDRFIDQLDALLTGAPVRVSRRQAAAAALQE